jgi:hypothetical protein
MKPERVFETSRKKAAFNAVFMTLVCLGMGAAGRGAPRPMFLVLCFVILFFALGIFASVLLAVRGGVVLRLDPEGFERVGLRGRSRRRWKDIEDLRMELIQQSAKVIAVRYKPGSEHRNKAARVIQEGGDELIHNIYTTKLDEIYDTMLAWRERYAAPGSLIRSMDTFDRTSAEGATESKQMVRNEQRRHPSDSPI